MGQVVIDCPDTGKPLSTGMSMPKETFESSSFDNNSVGPCPHCKKMHTWSKADARVQE